MPENYVKITSGVGEALPRHLVIVPLKITEDVYGIIEIASFGPIQKYQIEFLEKLGESIASTIKNVKINESIEQLLENAQEQSEELRA